MGRSVLRVTAGVLVSLLVWLMLSHSSSVSADSVTPPQPWKRHVGGGRYVFIMDSEWTRKWDGPQTTEAGVPYPAAGLYRNDGSTTPLWTVEWYAWHGAVHISSDGRHLATVNEWPESFFSDDKTPLVDFYEDGKLLKQYTVKELVGSSSVLPHSVSHFRWAKKVSFNDARSRLTVVTIPRATYVFDVTTGKVVQATSFMRMVAGIMLLVVVLPLGIGYVRKLTHSGIRRTSY